ncbi:hypothetical protein HanPSC8_Chr03g0096821 [Helianthus annuus]|nr:hypothetical protein HanPSC8_Chr03g0096821 [Helianthus annuus]
MKSGTHYATRPSTFMLCTQRICSNSSFATKLCTKNPHLRTSTHMKIEFEIVNLTII